MKAKLTLVTMVVIFYNMHFSLLLLWNSKELQRHLCVMSTWKTILPFPILTEDLRLELFIIHKTPTCETLQIPRLSLHSHFYPRVT